MGHGYGNTLPPTSYGYGIKTYGYGNTLPPTTYGYGIKTYGYGNTLPPTTYGYGVVNTIKCSIGYQKVTINGKTECRIINDKNIFQNLEKRIVEWKNIAAKQIATINHQIQTLQTKKNSINKDLETKILKERAKIYGAYGYGNNTLFQKAVKGIKIWFNGNK